jgi:sulfopyruvate decarboxylase TPP-binding subunit
MAQTNGGAVRWQDELYDLLRRNNVTQFAYVPDAGHRILIDRSLADPGVHSVALTTEEEGVALMAGADLGGARGVLLMQSSGAGNCINMLGMLNECRIPLLALVTMRGQWGEFNPWQVPMSRATVPALEAVGVVTQPVDRAAEIAETVEAAARLAFNTCRMVAVLISQRVIGAKQFK